MPRVIVLGTGTGVGKTFFSVALARALDSPGRRMVRALKPVETGHARRASGEPPPGSDAARLERATGDRSLRPHPLYLFAQPVSAHLGARASGTRISLSRIQNWLEGDSSANTLPYVTIVETAGGVFSPLSPRLTNFDLAMAVEPSIWILVAPDALGTLHDTRATLMAMTQRGRRPDHIVLSAARRRDASTGTNAAELVRVGLPRPVAVLGRGAPPADALAPLVRVLSRARP